MCSLNTYKFRLYPTRKQAEKLEWTLARCCELYNAGATSTYLLTLSEATNKEVCW
ncbi:helix-turn-helix domain-containing protein [Ktedonobacter racemifer]|uniref:helix-turn-helix domain-containing protein n=1 Tax=Ktedonobacter racemifer TaxID=363277 RepID=UPI000A063ECB